MADIDTTHLAAGTRQRAASRPALLEGINRINGMTNLTGAGYPLNQVGGRIDRVLHNGMYNMHPRCFSRTRAGLARHRAGLGTLKVALVGDSTESGVGSNPAASNTDIRRRACASVLARILTSRYGLKASAMGFFGDGWESGNLAVADPRLTLGSGWTIYQTMVPGGWALRDATTTQTPLAFAPSTSIATDRLDLWVIVYPGYADAVVSTSGTFNGSAPSNGPAGIKKYTISRPPSTAPWVIQKSGLTLGSDLIVIGAEAWVSGDNPIRIWNMGAAGSKVEHWAAPNEAWNAKNALVHEDFRPDLASINLSINDWSSSTTETVYKNGLATLVESWLVHSDVLLQVGVSSNLAAASQARQDQVMGWKLAIAEQYRVPCVVWPDRWGPQALYPLRGFYFDGQHPSPVGYEDKADVLARVICEV